MTILLRLHITGPKPLPGHLDLPLVPGVQDEKLQALIFSTTDFAKTLMKYGGIADPNEADRIAKRTFIETPVELVRDGQVFDAKEIFPRLVQPQFPFTVQFNVRKAKLLEGEP